MHCFLTRVHRLVPRNRRARQHGLGSALGALLALIIALVPLAAPPPAAYAAGNLTVKVYNDAGRDGVDTGGAEPGLAGVSVAVYSADNRLVVQNNTDAAGLVTFPGLSDGSYRVEVITPGGFVVSVPGAANTNPGLVSRVQIAGAASTVSFGLRQLTGGVDSAAPAGTRSITARVWDDLDGDGIQDADEPGISGQTVELLDSSNTVLQTATAGADGRYRFDAAPAISGLRVRVATVPAGYTLTAPNTIDPHFFPDSRDSDAPLPVPPVTLPPPPPVASVPGSGQGVNDATVAVGFTRGAISGFIWRDVNNNGLYDSTTEPRLNGVAVQLADGTGNTIGDPTFTRSEVGIGSEPGVFRFTGLPFGTYRVRIPSSEFQAGRPLFGTANSVNAPGGDRGTPDGIPAGAVEIASITLAPANVGARSHLDTAAHLGFYNGTVGDFVWLDVNRDGMQTGEESLGQNGLLLFVDDGRGGGIANNGVRDGGELSTTTADDPVSGLAGYYRFTDLPLGATYRVVLDSSNFAPGAPLEGIEASTGTRVPVVGGTPYYSIISGQLTDVQPTDFGADFGLIRSDLGNVVFEDRDGNGVFDAGEPIIPGVTVRIYRVSSGALVRTTTTDSNGAYSILGLPAVPYIAHFDLSTATDPNDRTMVGSLRATSIAEDAFTDLTTRVNATTWRTDAFTPVAGVINNGIDAGFFSPGRVTGRVFFDANRDNQDSATAEPGLRGVTVQLRRADDSSLVATTQSALDDTGAFTFDNILPGEYVVDVVNPDPDNFTFVMPGLPDAASPLASDVADGGPNPGRTPPIDLLSGQTIEDVDAGLAGRGQVSGRVFLDNDAGDTQNAGDLDLAGASASMVVTVNLPNLLVATYSAPNALASPTALANPNYRFVGLPGGPGVSYALSFTPPTATPAYQASTADQGGDDATDSDGPSVSVSSPAKGASLDFDQGYFQPVTITARVFEESGGAAINNQYAVGDAVIANVSVALEPNAGGTAVDTQTTDANGIVTFTVRPGSYRLNVNQVDPDLNGLIPSPNHADPVAVAGNPLTSGEESLTDGAGANSFGYYRGATITGQVFFDRNLDNLKAGEPGVQGVSVSVLGPSNPAAVTTDADGAYTISGLLPGNYTVRFANPDTGNFAFIAAGDSDVILPGAFPTRDTGANAVGYNATVANVDAGMIGQSTVNGITFEDANYDGQSTADSRLPGVNVTLNHTVSIPDRLSTTIVRTAATNGSGAYSFIGLPSGTFNLSFQPPAPPPTWLPTRPDQGDNATDSDGADELTAETLGGTSTQSRDQGYYQPVTITARVFEERTGAINNQYAAGDTGIANVTVVLEQTADGSTVATQTTDANGLVSFTVTPGSYRLNIDQTDTDLAGLIASPNHADPVVVVGNPLTSGEESLTDGAGANSFGYYQPGTVTGSVFFDGAAAAPDNLRAGEPGVRNVTVRLLDDTLAVVRTTTTDADGAYTFANVPPGAYTVEFVNPAAADLQLSTTVAGDNSVAALAGDDGRTAQFSVTPGATQTRRAAVVGRGTVSGSTFVDGNGNGVQGDAADGPLNNVTVSLTHAVNIPNHLSATISRGTPTAAGAYSFAGLPSGTFGLTFAPPAATPPYQTTLPDQGGDDTLDSDGELTLQGLAAGATADRDQGFFQPVRITARVFEDSPLPLNNQWNNSESGIAGVRVLLETHPAGTAVADATTLDTSGLVSFTVPPGSYRLRVDEASAALSGRTRTTGNTGQVVVAGSPLTSGQQSLTQATPVGTTHVFGYVQPGTVTGSVFFDGAAAVPDNLRAGEPGVRNVTVRLLDDTLAVVRTTTTDADGAYTFANVLPGNYTVEFVNPAATDLQFSTIIAADNSVAALAGANGRTNQSGVFPGATQTRRAAMVGRSTVSGSTFVDSNADGIQDVGDGPLSGVTVALTHDVNIPNHLSTTISRSAMTTSAGAYSFVALPSGTFGLTFAPPVATPPYQTTLPDQGGDDTLDSDGTGTGLDQLTGQTLAAGVTADRDQGFFQPGTVTGSVFFDGAAAAPDNLRAGEPGVRNVTVRLLDDTLAVVRTTTTDADGAYTFANVLPGAYTVEFVNPAAADLQLSTTVAGDNSVAALAGDDGRTAQFSVTSGATQTRRAAVVGRGTVSGSTFVDGNGNGVQGDAADGPLNNVTVSLTHAVNIPNHLSATISRGTPTAAGAYSFAGLPSGTFGLTFAPPAATPPYQTTLPDQGGDDTLDSDGTGTGLDQLTGQTLAAGATADRDQGFFQPVTITARVFEDSTLPLNNQWNNSESGIAGVRVLLETHPAGTAVADATTLDTSGLVSFTVPPGSYRLRVDEASAALSGRTRTTGNTGQVVVAGNPLTSGQQSLTQATPVGTTHVFGYVQPGTVTGSVFFDGAAAAPDNLRAGEPGVRNVTVRLLDDTLAVVRTTTTDADGAYTFANVPPGAYTVEFVNPAAADLQLSTTVAGDNSVAALAGDDGRTAQFSVTSGATQTRRAAGLGRGTVSGSTFVDGNGNGVQGDAADGPLNNVTVSLTHAVNIPNHLSATISRGTPTAAGAYSFAGLPSGTFGLTFAPPAATPPYQTTLPDQGGDDTLDSDGTGTGLDQLTGQTLAAGVTADRDQGFFQPVTITARVFEETVTVDNTFQAGEAGVGDVTVTLNPGGQTQQTNASGVATFTVAPGTYTVTAPQPTGLTRTTGNNGSGTTPALTSGQSATLDFGHYRPGLLTGGAWFDTDGDGALEAGEPGMQGISVTLVGSASGTVGTATTLQDGSFSLTNVPPTGGAMPDATYRLCFSQKPGLAYTTKGAALTTDGNSDVNVGGPNDGCTDPFTVASNESVTTIDAGYVGTFSIGDLAWFDENANGVQDAGEAGLAGVTVTLAITTTGGLINDTNPTITLSATSTATANLAPNYLVTRAPPGSGSRVVSAVPPLGYTATAADQGGDDAADSDPVGSYPALAASITNLDFGFFRTAAIGDRVWLDLNGNGAFDPATDRGYAGVTVELLSAATQQVVSSTTTLAAGDVGSYRFDNVVPGSYRVRFTAPPGLVFVNDAAGSPAVDGDNDASLAGLTAAFDVVSAQVLGTVDAGLRGTGSIAGFAWLDENQDDIRQATETQRLPGIQATLTLTPTGLASPLTLQATTGADGAYRFEGLPPGAYRVVFVPTPNLFPVRPGAGPDRAADSDGPVAAGVLAPGQAVSGLDAGYRREFTTFLPLIRGNPGRPDLVATFTIAPDRPSYRGDENVVVTVTVTNRGNESTTAGFWVDLYLNPVTPPTRANVRWDSVCSAARGDACRGIAWYVGQSLAPGQSITLTSTPGSYQQDSTVWDGRLPAGTTSVYVYVDSWNPTVAFGAIEESNEANNRAERTGLVVTGDGGTTVLDAGRTAADLPPRPAVP